MPPEKKTLVGVWRVKKTPNSVNWNCDFINSGIKKRAVMAVKDKN